MTTIPPMLEKLLKSARVKHIERGQTLLYAGDHSAEVQIIKEGIIKLYSIDDRGNEKILHLLSAPMVVPLSFFSRPEITPRWYYNAHTDCDLYTLSRQELQKLMETDPMTMHFLVNTFSEEVHEILTRLESLGKTDISTKLASALSYLVVCHGVKENDDWWRIPFAVNHQLLADMTGVSRETVSLAMKSFSDLQIIRNPRLAQLEVDFEKLKAHRLEMAQDK